MTEEIKQRKDYMNKKISDKQKGKTENNWWII